MNVITMPRSVRRNSTRQTTTATRQSTTREKSAATPAKSSTRVAPATPATKKRISSFVGKTPKKDTVKKDTVKYLKDLLCHAVEERFLKLYSLWDSMTLDGKTKRERTRTIKKHIEEYLDGMVEEEFSARENLLDSLGTYIKNAHKLRKKLGVNYEEPDENLPLMKYEEAVRQEVDRLEGIRDQRIREAEELGKKEKQLCDTLDREVEEDEVNSIPSVEQLEALRERVAKLEDEVEKIVRMKDMRSEIKMLWDNCFYSEQQRSDFGGFHSEELSEELFAQHKAELGKLKEYFATNKELLTKLGKWIHVWKQAVELERKIKDPSRLTNMRENVLLQQEREKKKVMKVLPKLELEITNLIYDWEEKEGEIFLVEGVSFVRFLEKQREGQDALLAQEKLAREEAKQIAREEAKKKVQTVAGRTRSRVPPLDNSLTRYRVPTADDSPQSPIRKVSKVLGKKKMDSLGLKTLNRRSLVIKKDSKVRATPARAAKTKATTTQAKALREVLLLNEQTKKNGQVLEAIAESKLATTLRKGNLFNMAPKKKFGSRKDSICKSFSSIKL